MNICISKLNFQWIFETLFSMIDMFIVYISDPRQYVLISYIYIQYIEYEPKVESYQILKKIFYNYIIYIFHRQCMIYNVNDKRYNNI